MTRAFGGHQTDFGLRPGKILGKWKNWQAASIGEKADGEKEEEIRSVHSLFQIDLREMNPKTDVELVEVFTEGHF